MCPYLYDLQPKKRHQFDEEMSATVGIHDERSQHLVMFEE